MTIVTAAEFLKRRQQLFAQMPTNSIMIIPSAPEIIRNGDGHYLYRQNSDFYYITGFNEPEAVAVLLRDNNHNTFHIFNRPNDPLMETWNGKRAGLEGTVKIFGADKSTLFAEFEKHLPDLLHGRDILYFAFGRQMQWDRVINKGINTLREKVRSGISVPQTIINPEIFLHEMRLHKSPLEIATMQKACEITVKSHVKAMQHCSPLKYEYELQAVMSEEWLRHGSFAPAYSPIVGSGENSCILHYSENNRQISDGDMVLIDAGCEFENYSSDITRSFPANGKFSQEQRAIYDIVLQAQLTTLKEVKPGTSYPVMHETAVKIITEGLLELGLLKGKVANLIEQNAYMTFYMHRTGHWLGLDTHDVGNYKPNNEWRKLAPGMVLTVEPGIYIAPNTPNVDKKWWNIGIRIEDDVLVTENGHDILSKNLIKQIDDIEALMRS